MAVYFLDSSAVVKRYVQEAGSAWVHDLFGPPDGNEVWIARITPVEVVAAIARRTLAARLPESVTNSACALLRLDLRNDYQIVGVDGTLVDIAMDIAQRYALRGYDAMQLAAACHVHAIALAQRLAPITLVSADLELNAAAALEGLIVEDPNTHI